MAIYGKTMTMADPEAHANIANSLIDQATSAAAAKHPASEALAICAQAQATLAVAAALERIGNALAFMADKPTFRD
ncbi:hypothetical protein ABZU32_35825 [Sphaerisporangium sp. NPDC005288]|uniref:hypothetical protein n=1 Tax=Sphaerisporangium sp. NPDC005288 TaxID=3155114 RepID=UPI0033A17516